MFLRLENTAISTAVHRGHTIFLRVYSLVCRFSLLGVELLEPNSNRLIGHRTYRIQHKTRETGHIAQTLNRTTHIDHTAHTVQDTQASRHGPEQASHILSHKGHKGYTAPRMHRRKHDTALSRLRTDTTQNTQYPHGTHATS